MGRKYSSLAINLTLIPKKMKKQIIGLIVVCVFGLMSCFEDDSILGNPDHNTIEISGLKDTMMISLAGEVLNINPEIQTGYPESSLAYAWYLFSGEDDDLENGYRENKIAETRELNYEINLPSGTYTLVFEVTSTDDGASHLATMQLRTATSYSQGFYILKETADGQTELDVYGRRGLFENLLTEKLGAPLSGKPTNLSVVYGQCYIDEETLEMAGCNMIHVFTETEYRGFRSEDMQEFFDKENITFDGFSSGEKLYTMANGMNMIYFLTSEGIRAVSNSGFILSSGRYGLMVTGGVGGSKYILPVGGGMMFGYYYWNDVTHSLYMTDYNATSVMPVSYNAGNIDESNLTCIAAGVNMVGFTETDCFVCENTITGERYLYLIDGSTGILTIKELDSNLHIAQGELISVNGCSATYLYVLHENKVYAYNWNEDTESEVSLPGFSSNEKIVYLSNQYLQAGLGDPSADFNNLIIATEQSGNYKLYFFDGLVGGLPVEEATVIEGTGHVKSVRFVSAVVDPLDFMNGAFGYPVLIPFAD